jgi:hypothetical protein
MIGRKVFLYKAILSFLLVPLLVSAQDENPAAEEAKAMIRQIYSDVSGDGTDLPDWERIRSYFVEEALIVLRTSQEGNTQFTLEEFIQDFKDFYNSPALENSGFREEVVQLKSHVYHDIAFIAVVYEAKILNADRPPQQGVDFWLLTRKEGTWKVLAVSNEIVRPGEGLPPPFDQAG